MSSTQASGQEASRRQITSTNTDIAYPALPSLNESSDLVEGMRSTNDGPQFSEDTLYKPESSDEEETPAQQAEDQANRKALLREGQRARVEQFKKAVVPLLAQQCYNNPNVTKAFQAILKKPEKPDAAKQRLSTVNEVIRDIILIF